jgi:hypothetical protein
VVRLPPDGFWRDFVTATNSDLISNKTNNGRATRVSIVEVGYNVMKRTEYLTSLQMSVVITEEYSVMVNCIELNGRLPQKI